MPPSVLFVSILIIFIILVAIIIKTTAGNHDLSLSYEKNFSLLSAPEKAFLETLEPLLGDRHTVFVKVRLADIIQIQQKPGKELPVKTLARINATTVSFVLCNAGDLSIAGIIDLENKTATAKAEDMPDDFIDNAATAAGLPIARVQSRLQYDPEDIIAILSKNIELPENPTVKIITNKYGDCPSCGEPLMLLKAKQGENIGKYFLGCSNYPECKYLSMLNNNEPGLAMTDATQMPTSPEPSSHKEPQ